MKNRLVGVHGKLARADEHIETLSEEVRRYRLSEPYELIERVGPKGWGYRLRIEDPPSRIQILVGDAVHNIRSALDHLAWQLVFANGGRPTEGLKGTTFPILTRPGRVRVAGGVSAKALRLIEKCQPFRAAVPDETPLAVLARLSNTDKHRHLTAIGRYVGGFTVHTSQGSVAVTVPFELNEDPFFTVFDQRPSGDIRPVAAAADLRVTLLDSGGMFLMSAEAIMRETLTFARNLVRHFEREGLV